MARALGNILPVAALAFSVCLFLGESGPLENTSAMAATRAATVHADPNVQPSDRLDFGRLTLQEPLEHTFYFRNESLETLEISNVTLQPPLSVLKGTTRVVPGGQGSITVSLGQPRQKGAFRGEVVVNFKQPATGKRVFLVIGTLVPEIELNPAYGFYLVAQRGQRAKRSLELINHGKEPLKILRAEYAGSKFTTELKALEIGVRYRLTLHTKPDAPAGRATETIRLLTSNPDRPVLPVQANVWIKERVYAFPETLELGTIRTDEVRGAPNVFAQSLMVYQVGGTDFQVTAETDVPFLSLSAVRSSLDDRYQITASLIPERLTPGKISGSIVVTTNDVQFPRLTIPVRGSIDGEERK